MRHLTKALCSAAIVICCCTLVRAEDGVLVVHITDTEDRPLSGIVMSPKGDGSVSPPADRAGRTRIRLPPSARPGRWVSLQVVGRQADNDVWVFISPWDSRVIVPSFDNETENFVSVVLAKRSDKVLLENGRAISAITKSILNELASKPTEKRITDEDRRAVLKEQANKYGLMPEQIDRAIRAWGENTKDPFERGLAALYARKYQDATKQLSESFQMRMRELETSRAKIIEAATFLEQSFFEQGRFREASEVLQKAADIRPDDSKILNDLGMALLNSGEYAKSESAFHKALTTDESTPASTPSNLVETLTSLGAIYIAVGRFTEAERDLQRARRLAEQDTNTDPLQVAVILNNLAILDGLQGRWQEWETLIDLALTLVRKHLGENHPDFAYVLINKATLYINAGRYVEAERTLKQSKAIFESLRTPAHPYLATNLYLLAYIYESQNRFSEADSLFIQSLAIRESALGPQHPNVAESLIGVARSYFRRGEYKEAESKARQAIKILESSGAGGHVSLATVYNALAEAYVAQDRRTEAEKFFRRSVEVTESTVGTEHYATAIYLNNEAVNYFKQDKYNEAERLYLRAISIWEKLSGSDLQHPHAVVCLANLAKLYGKQGRYEDAEREYKRAIVIADKVLASNPEALIMILEDYAQLLKQEHRDLEAEGVRDHIRGIRAKSNP